MNKPIHQITAVYLGFIILIRMMAMPISLVDYSLNRHFISKNLCENRMRTGISCAGKCFLNKQLTKTNDNPASPDQKGGIKILLVDYCESPDNPSIGIWGIPENNTPPFQNRPLVSRSPENIFRPPIA